MTVHMVIGFVLAPLALAHAWSAMNLPGVRGTSAAGLWIATLALLLLVVQGLIGLSLLQPGGPHGIRSRRLHLFHYLKGIVPIAVEADKGRFVMPIDYLWIKLGDDKALPLTDIGPTSINAHFTESILTPKVGIESWMAST